MTFCSGFAAWVVLNMYNVAPKRLAKSNVAKGFFAAFYEWSVVNGSGTAALLKLLIMDSQHN
jgi:hypothetical protein